MKNIPQISEAEWQVMKVLWSHSPLTANGIIEELGSRVSWKPKTVKTLISRLVSKKALGYEKDSRLYRYFPLVSENECVKEESKSFLERVYGGAIKALLVNFIEEEPLSREDIEELKRLLDGKKD